MKCTLCKISVQLLSEVGMEDVIDELTSHFCSNVLCTVQRLQSAEEKTSDVQNTLCSEGDWTMDVAGNELLKCIDGLSKVKVCETNCQ